jgi:hypothetical protein
LGFGSGFGSGFGLVAATDALDVQVLVPEEGLEPLGAHLALELVVVRQLRLHRALHHQVQELVGRVAQAIEVAGALCAG